MTANAVNAMCMICRQKTAPDQMRYRLARMRNIMRTRYGSVKTPGEPFPWDIHFHCRYGFACPKILRTERELNQIAKELDGYLTEALRSRDKDAYSQILPLLRGHQTRVYNAFVAKAVKREEEAV